MADLDMGGDDPPVRGYAGMRCGSRQTAAFFAGWGTYAGGGNGCPARPALCSET